jgi:radical SAM family uncharacterized protein/radical SAM-linked protein
VNLLYAQRPSRYINNELNSIHKKGLVRVALAFPDVYEVGMSHLGLKILYHIVNSLPYASAERVFSPWLDHEDSLRKEGILLSSLESKSPLRDFDIVGFSLQYELSYTTVLNMLHLGGLPARSEERLGMKGLPLVIAGGPCTLNPYPMAAFIDAFLIGDGEDAVKEILDIFLQWKQDGTSDKITLLGSLAEVGGVFVPSLGKCRKVSRRIVRSLEDAPFPDSPILPFTNIVHDRINIEIARGCSMGCRFCQAGMACRPVRERSPARILELAENSLKNTGYSDLSFTSLSAGDYSCLLPLLSEFNRKFHGERVAISLPSLRVASVNSGILREIKTVRKTGFTMAPEAGTDRLRAVINKDFTEESYVAALEVLFREGWKNLKLYFMTGLPTERDEDIEAIPEMVAKAIKISRKLTGRHVNISVGVSSFIPKPHTPFQWFGQNDIAVLKEKNGYLKKALLRKGIKYKGHDEEMSLLEAVFARGDERLCGLIESAWSLGCRLDAWTESFDFVKWTRAMETTGIDAFAFARREIPPESPLAWDNIETGVTKEYLRKEYLNALSSTFTQDCRNRCLNCGLKCGADSQKGGPEAVPEMPHSPSEEMRGHTPSKRITERTRIGEQSPSIRVRLEYSKTGDARYLSHLELMTALIRALRRAEFPLKYSSGFHPSPKVSFGPALGVGIAGLREYLDMELFPPYELDYCLMRLNRTLPPGLHARNLTAVYGGEKSLDSSIIKYTYEVRNGNKFAVGLFMQKDEVFVTRKDKIINIREMVDAIEPAEGGAFLLTVHDLDEGLNRVRLDELLPVIFNVPAEELEVTRTSLFLRRGGLPEETGKRRIWAARS